MESSMGASVSAQSAEAAQALSRWWWAWLVSGAVWILASIVILQFRHSSIALVGVIIGIMFLVGGIEDIVVAFVSESGWRWLSAALGVLLIIAGIYALFNPVQTFLAVADLLGFVFAMVGIFWTIQAFASVATNPLWWLGLISGILMIALGFWAGGQFLATQAYTLLIFAGIWALLHGIGDLIKGFAIKRIGDTVAASVARGTSALG